MEANETPTVTSRRNFFKRSVATAGSLLAASQELPVSAAPQQEAREQQEKRIPFRVLNTGITHGLDISGTIIISTQQALEKYWNQLTTGYDPQGNKPPAPNVNFDENVLVMVLRPTREDKGWNIDVQDVVETPDGQARIITIEKSLREESSETMVTAPYAVIELPRTPATMKSVSTDIKDEVSQPLGTKPPFVPHTVVPKSSEP